MSDNPRPIQDIDKDLAGKIADHFGYDQCIIIARKTGDDGGVCVTSAGLTVKSAMEAMEAAKWITGNLSHWMPEEALDIDRMAREELRKQDDGRMNEGPESDPSLGKRLIHLPGSH